MGSSLLFHEALLYQSAYKLPTLLEAPKDKEDGVRAPVPSINGLVLYSVITPIICVFGICGNILSLMVLRRRELVGSVYTYLAVLATMDLLMSLVFLIGGLCRVFCYYSLWATYDGLIGLPLGGAINSLSVIATVAVTIDRVLFLWHPEQSSKPKFCNQKIARKLMSVGFVFAVLLNVPYCFIFEWDEFGRLRTTKFFDSRLYATINWFMLILFFIIPGMVLLFGNGFLIMSLRKVRKIGMKSGKRKNHTSLTMTLISIILLFLLAEIPSNLLSRTRAITVLFSGDPEETTNTLEVFRQVCSLLGAINVTVNFLFYYLFCPAFCKALKKVIRRNKPKKTCRKFQVNVFVVNRSDKTIPQVKTNIVEITRNAIESPFASFDYECQQTDETNKIY